MHASERPDYLTRDPHPTNRINDPEPSSDVRTDFAADTREM